MAVTELPMLPTTFAMLLSLILIIPPLTSSSLNQLEQTTPCPINFSYVQHLPWDTTPCASYNASLPYHDNRNQTSPMDQQEDPNSHCCQTLISLLGIGMAAYLKLALFFHLPDRPTSASCVAGFQSELDHRSLLPDLASACFGSDPSRFVRSSETCAGIQTKQDWVQRLGSETDLDAVCKGNLSDLTLCNSCLAAGLKVSARLTALDGNSSHATDCFYFTVIYAGGVVNSLGPEDPATAACVMGLALVDASSMIQRKSRKVWIFAMIGGLSASAFVFSLVGGCIWCQYRMGKKKTGRSSVTPKLEHGEDYMEASSKTQRRPNTGSIWFSMDDLEKATDNFSQKNLIGRGGFGVVYKGMLPDGSQVAVKKVIESDFQRDDEFYNEVEIISNLRHRNLVPLRGCCMTEEDQPWGEKQWYLVYDYMPHGSLDDHIFAGNGSPVLRKPLTWAQRRGIILDVAKGLAYLHYGVKPAVYHRDIKATNILLGEDMRARVADFGVAKKCREGESYLTTRVAGTHGYLAPEYALYGQLTEKSDVFSFGVLVLEVLSGRRALVLHSFDSPRTFLITDWAWSLVKSGRMDEAFDVGLVVGDGFKPSSVMERFLLVGILCSHLMVVLRPTIVEALKMLEGDIDVPDLPDRPFPYVSGECYSAMEGNTFSLSTILSGPLLETREMSRLYNLQS